MSPHFRAHSFNAERDGGENNRKESNELSKSEYEAIKDKAINATTSTGNGRSVSFEDNTRFTLKEGERDTLTNIKGMINMDKTANFGDDNFRDERVPSEGADYFELN